MSGRRSPGTPRDPDRLVADDTLYSPTLRWHHVTTVEAPIAVNFWWSRGVQGLISVAADAYKRVRGLAA